MFIRDSNCFHQGQEEQFEELEILKHLKSNGFVVDYDWPYKKVVESEQTQRPKI